MIMLRNPWGVSYYNGPWSSYDYSWTQDLIDKYVPFGFDPRKLQSIYQTEEGVYGAFVMPLSSFVAQSSYYDNCFENFLIGHYRDKEGY